MLFGKGVLKICSKVAVEQPYRSLISIKLFCNFVEITLGHGCSPLNLLYIFRTHFPKNTSGGLLQHGGLLLINLFLSMMKLMQRQAFKVTIRYEMYLLVQYMNQTMICKDLITF